MLGQRPHGVVLRQPETRGGLPDERHPRRRAGDRVRVHRAVLQPRSAALVAGVPFPGGVRVPVQPDPPSTPCPLFAGKNSPSPSRAEGQPVPAARWGVNGSARSFSLAGRASEGQAPVPLAPEGIGLRSRVRLTSGRNLPSRLVRNRPPLDKGRCDHIDRPETQRETLGGFGKRSTT